MSAGGARRDADVVVVGAGTAGSVVARRLAEAGADVLLLEAGHAPAPPTAGLMDIGPASRVVARHRALVGADPSPGAGGPGESGPWGTELPRGCTPGGSGAVNGGYCVPAPPSDLRRWGPGWPRRYDVGLARATERLRPGLWPMGPIAAALAPRFPGEVSAVPQARRGARRVTAFGAWDPVGAGVRVRTGAPVVGLRWAGGRVAGRCDGVLVRRGVGVGAGGPDDDDVEEISARQVVLCAGAIGTARLLLGSGIGPASGHPVGGAAREHPEVLLDLPAHLARLADDAGRAGRADRARRGSGATPGPYPRLAPPPLLSHVFRLVSAGGHEVEVRPYALPMHRVIPGLEPAPHRIGIALMTPEGEARVGRGGPVLLPDDPGDAAVLARAVDLVADRLGLDGPVVAVPSTSQHLAGTAPIGHVVDDSGRVLGVPGLRVADASVFPALPRRGPYYSVLAVAEDLAARMAAERAW